MAQAGPTRNWARVLGVLALVVGVVGAIVLWVAASKRYDDAVADLAPAPVGCDTQLDFERTGTYTFFVETAGSVGEIDGDCESDDRDYEFDGDETPRVELTLVDDDGDEVDLDRADGPSYDRGGSRGTAVRTADIDATGEYVLRVSGEVDDVMVRVGQDPASGVLAMRVGAGLLLALGVVLGVVGLVAGRRPATEARPYSYGVPQWPPLSGEPFSRPTAPPYANPPVPPPYGRAESLPPPDRPAPDRPPGQPSAGRPSPALPRPGERGGSLPPPRHPGGRLPPPTPR
jgi:hypothetical protein